MSNDKLANEARQIIDGIRRHQVNTENKLTNVEKQVSDLKVALQKMTEASEKPVVIEAKNDGLKQFVRDDGLQLFTQKRSVNIHGYGPIRIKEEGLIDTQKNHSEWHHELKQIVTKKNLLKTFCAHTPKTDAQLIRHLDKAPSFMKAAIQKSLYDAAGQGAEFIPDEFRDQLYMEYKTPSMLAEQFEVVPTQSNTILIPRFDNPGGRPYIKGALTSDDVTANIFTASTPTTAQASIAIKGFAARYRVSSDLIEDAAVSILPSLQNSIYRDLTDGYEDCMLNGDTTAVHADDIANWNIRSRWGTAPALGGASDHRRNFKGLRRLASDASTSDIAILGGAAATADDIISGLALMAEYSSQDMMLVTSPEMLLTLLKISAVQTIDKYGPAATIVSGSLASIFGMPILVSRYMGADLNGSGLFDNVLKTKSGIILVNRASYKHYQRRGITVETQRDINSDSVSVVATMRRTFASPDPALTKNVAYLANTEPF
tara:strand:+ start:308 stop:1771 length:1464 start_codon:yes stop_codon:yes gene_type:complete